MTDPAESEQPQAQPQQPPLPPKTQAASAIEMDALRRQVQRRSVDDNGKWVFKSTVTEQARKAQRRAEAERAISLLNTKKNGGPHEYMWAMRGVPMGPGMPPLNLPPQVQNALAQHIENCGFVHDPERQRVKHRAPLFGPNISINPGEWVSVDAPDSSSSDPAAAAAASVASVPDFTGTHPDQIRAIEQAVHNEKIRLLKLHHSDLAAQADASPRVVQTFSAVGADEFVRQAREAAEAARTAAEQPGAPGESAQQ